MEPARNADRIGEIGVADSCPSITNTPGSATEICQKVGDAPYVDVIPPIYNTGSKHRTGTFDCSSNTTNQTGTITYTVSGVTWDPALPTKFTAANVPTFTSTAYVDVTSSDPSLCSDGTGHKSFATCTWLVHNTNQPCAPSSSVTLNAYFASDSVGYRLYAHTFTEFYTKIYSCSDPKEQWHLTLSTASLKAYHMDDTYTWGETHQYSFQTGSTAMSEAYGIGEEGTDYDQLSEDFLVSPQSGLTGTAAASLTWNNDDGGGTPGIIISGGSITISIQ